MADRDREDLVGGEVPVGAGNANVGGEVPAGGEENVGGEMPAGVGDVNVGGGVSADGGVGANVAEIDDLRKQLQDMTALMAALARQQVAASVQQPVQQPTVIHVATSSPRLKTFTGQSPKTSQEATFLEWETQCEQLLQDQSIPAVLDKIKGSLRGIAFEQVRTCNDAETLLSVLRGVYGEVKTPDDLYLDFCSRTVQHKETSSSFLCRLWDEMNQINKAEKLFSQEEANKKIYLIFAKNISQSMAIELRATHGFPGESSPNMTDLLKTVRRLEVVDVKPKVQAGAHAASCESQLSEADLDRLAKKIAKELGTSSQQQPQGQSGPAGPSLAPRKPQGPCFNCGVVGEHFARDCTNKRKPKGPCFNCGVVGEHFARDCTNERKPRKKWGNDTGSLRGGAPVTPKASPITSELGATERQTRIMTAIDVLEKGLAVRPVHLRDITVNLEAGQVMELRGKIPNTTSVKVYPRTEDFLPTGLVVNRADVIEGSTLVVTVQNSSRRGIKLTPDLILAEISTDSDLLEAVVGPSCEVQVDIEGVTTRGLLDSGSQVTVLSESFYRTHLAHVPLQKLQTDLRVIGAGGQSVPFIGMVSVSCTVPASVAGSKQTVDIAALIQENNKYSVKVPVTLGTNVFKKLSEVKFPGNILKGEAAFMFAHKLDMSDDGKCGHIKLKGKPVVIPPNASVCVRGRAKVKQMHTHNTVLLQEPIEGVLPEGLGVVAATVGVGDLHVVDVTLCNFSDSDVVIKRNQTVADVFLVHATYDIEKFVIDHHASEQDGISATVQSTQMDVGSEEPSLLSFKFGENTTPEWRQHFTKRLMGFQDVFIKDEFDIGGTSAIFHDVKLEDGPAIHSRPRPIPPADFEDAKRHIQELLDSKIIAPSTSPYTSPIVLIRKKNGKLRMCVDYRAVNRRTIKDSYSVPKIEDMLLTLNGARFFTQMDLAKAFYQVPMTERAKQVSAFATPFGVYQFERMAMGMKNSPSTFQRLMEMVFADMNLVDLLVFLDDILIHSQTLADLEERTIQALERLRRHNLKLDPAKCVFGASEVRHLGYIISEGKIRPDPEKVSALTTWPVPKTVKELKSFVGFCGYWRRFIPNFAQIARPLNDLTIGYIPRGSKKNQKGTLTLGSDVSHLWGESQQSAFEILIKALSSEPVIGLAELGKPFELHCDASLSGIGAVLYQQGPDGHQKVIAYASRSLNKTERNYAAHKREFLALKWAMSEKFHDYIYGSHVTVVTDNNPLCYILQNAKLDATSHRWLASLSVYDFELRYKKGSTHIDADALSRRHPEPPEEDKEYQKLIEDTEFFRKKAEAFEQQQYENVNSATVQAVMEAKGVYSVQTKHQVYSCSQKVAREDKDIGDSNNFVPAVEQLVKDSSLIPDDILDPKESCTDSVSGAEWRKLQLADKSLAVVIRHLEQKQELVASQLETQELKVFAREQKKLVLKEGVLYRKTEEEDSVRWQLVVPWSHRKQALTGVHDELFHIHFEAALIHLRMRFFWPFMARDLERRIRKCSRCIMRGAKCDKAPMNSIVTTFPLELLSIDYLTIEVKGQKQNILVVIDHFTKFGIAICTADQTAKTVAKTLWREVFMKYGFPKRILSDQGRDFESQLLKEVCEIAGIKKCRTTPYHPAGNPVERWNRTLIQMLRSLENDKKSDWRKSLPEVVHAYNCCVHSSTGYSPYFLFFGRQPRLPVDIAFGIEVGCAGKKSPREYVKGLKRDLAEAYSVARKNMEKSARRNKARYDTSAHAAELEIGDRILVRRVGPKITGKVCDRWEEHVYTVEGKPGEMPVYTVKQENGEGPIRTLHRNLLLPIGMLEPDHECQREIQQEKAMKQTRSSKKQEEHSDDHAEEEERPDEFQIWIPGELRVEAPVFIPRQSTELLLERIQDRAQEPHSSGKSTQPLERQEPILREAVREAGQLEQLEQDLVEEAREMVKSEPPECGNPVEVIQVIEPERVEEVGRDKGGDADESSGDDVALESEIGGLETQQDAEAASNAGSVTSDTLSASELEEIDRKIDEEGGDRETEVGQMEEESVGQPPFCRRSSRVRRPVVKLDLTQRVERTDEQRKELNRWIKVLQSNLKVNVETSKGIAFALDRIGELLDSLFGMND